ncbi:unnamed protein product, partial [Laminaria digitata]
LSASRSGRVAPPVASESPVLSGGSCAEFDCETPLPTWNKQRPSDPATCGRQQAKVVSQLDIQAVLERQKQCGGADD